LGESHHLKAKAAFNVIAEMAHKFLSCRIRFMGAVPKGPDFTRSILTRTPLMIESPNSPATQENSAMLKITYEAVSLVDIPPFLPVSCPFDFVNKYKHFCSM
jgi:MinD-like ATPase involved in chromosome partitioning or flagellar assembly